MTDARVTKEGLDVLQAPVPDVRVTKEAFDVLRQPIVDVRNTKMAVDVLYSVLVIPPAEPVTGWGRIVR